MILSVTHIFIVYSMYVPTIEIVSCVFHFLFIFWHNCFKLMEQQFLPYGTTVSLRFCKMFNVRMADLVEKYILIYSVNKSVRRMTYCCNLPFITPVLRPVLLQYFDLCYCSTSTRVLSPEYYHKVRKSLHKNRAFPPLIKVAGECLKVPFWVYLSLVNRCDHIHHNFYGACI